MKKTVLTLLLLLLFTACNSEKTKGISNDAIQQANAFPHATRNPDEVICQNCHAKFKIATAMHKLSNGKVEIICPICHHVYLKKAH